MNLKRALLALLLCGCGAASPAVSSEPGSATLDSDNDGIIDSHDECPAVPGGITAAGCPDADGDSVADVRDECPDAPEDIDGWQDDNGCPDPDNDEDGLADNFDQCRDQAEDFDDHHDRDGCPDPDNDMDGVLDDEDLCPLRSARANPDPECPGCPAAYRWMPAAPCPWGEQVDPNGEGAVAH